jgi:PAS domain S-box-containing protein
MTRADLTREIEALRQEAAALQHRAGENPTQVARLLTQWCERCQQTLALLQPTATPPGVDHRDQTSTDADCRFAQFAMEHTAEAVFWIRRDGSLQYVNEQACRSLEYTRDELLRLRVSDFDPDVPPDLWPAVWEKTQTLGHRLFESQHRTKTGRVFPVEISADNLILDGVEYHCAFARDISARRQAETTQAETNRRLQLATEAGRLGLWDWNLADNSVYFSPQWKQLLGYADDEIRNELAEFDNRVHPDDRDRLHAFRRAALESSTVNTAVEFRLRHKDGTDRSILSRAQILRGPDGKPHHVLGCHIDITERKQIETALRASEERHRLLVESVPVLAWHCDAAGLLVDCNERWCEYTGQTPAETRGNGWMNALHPDDRNRVMQKVAADVAGGMIYQAEYRLLRGMDNTYRWHLARALPLKDSHGRILAWYGCAADIEEEKRALELLRQDRDQLEERVRARTAELSQSLNQLQAAQERFQQLANNIDEVFWMFDLNLTECLYISPAYESIWGLSCESLYRNPRSFLSAVHPEDLAFAEAVLKEKFMKGLDFMVEMRLLRSDGSTCWVIARGFPIRDSRGRPYRMAGLVQDITQRRRLEEAILDVAERQQQSIAHELHDDLCNQLAGLSYFAKGLEQQLTGQQKTAARRMSRQLRDALAKTRNITRGLHPITITPTSLPDALKRLAAEQSKLYRTVCQFKPSARIPTLSTRKATHLYRIAQEALHNAIKHAKAKRITMRLTVKDDQLILTVTDNGVGFPGNAATATGIGIQIMRHRADTIGGGIEIRPAKPSGTVVACHLPLLTTSNQESSHAAKKTSRLSR